MQPGETPPSAASFVQIPQELMEIQGLLGSVPGDSPVPGFCSGILGPDTTPQGDKVTRQGVNSRGAAKRQHCSSDLT